jgi:hypothetical protein
MTTKTHVQDWTGLTAGDNVQVFDPRMGPYLATVDTKTDDSSVLWIHRPGGGDRRAFDAREGIEITLAPKHHRQ